MTTASANDGMTIAIPGGLASGAHQEGEESELLVYLLAREVDARGSGRVAIGRVREWAEVMFSRKQFGRIVWGDKGLRYWDVEAEDLRLRGGNRVAASFTGDVLETRAAVSFPLRVLDKRPRRGAALAAAVLAGALERPRSNRFIERFAGVDRKTIGRWQKDRIIRDEILRKVPQWAWLDAADCRTGGRRKAR